MKKVLLSLLVIIIALGLLGAAGYAGYRYGFTQGMIIASARSNNANGSANGNGKVPPYGPGFGMMPRGMPMHNFGFDRGFGFDGRGGMMRRGYGFFPLFGFGFGLLARLLFWGLLIALIVWLVTRSGWRLTRTAPVAAAPAATTTVVESHPPAPANETTPPPAPTDEENPQS